MNFKILWIFITDLTLQFFVYMRKKFHYWIVFHKILEDILRVIKLFLVIIIKTCRHWFPRFFFLFIRFFFLSHISFKYPHTRTHTHRYTFTYINISFALERNNKKHVYLKSDVICLFFLIAEAKYNFPCFSFFLVYLFPFCLLLHRFFM